MTNTFTCMLVTSMFLIWQQWCVYFYIYYNFHSILKCSSFLLNKMTQLLCGLIPHKIHNMHTLYGVLTILSPLSTSPVKEQTQIELIKYFIPVVSFRFKKSHGFTSNTQHHKSCLPYRIVHQSIFIFLNFSSTAN